MRNEASSVQIVQVSFQSRPLVSTQCRTNAVALPRDDLGVGQGVGHGGRCCDTTPGRIKDMALVTDEQLTGTVFGVLVLLAGSTLRAA